MWKQFFVLLIGCVIVFSVGCAANTAFCKRCGNFDSEAPVKNPLPVCPQCPVGSDSSR